MKKRLLSLLLLCCMVLTWLPVTAAAAGESATAKGGDATFTLRAESSSCADGHTGELGSIQVTGVDISRWKPDKKITIQYSIRFRCTDPDCELYSADDSFQHDGEHTFTNVDAELCHKPFTGSFTDTFDAAYGTGSDAKKFSVSLTLTSDKGISETVYHAPTVKACTESYYSVRCWECTGCGYYFLQADMSSEKLGLDRVFFPAAGHRLKHVDAKAPTCVEKGTVEHWACERLDCQKNFSDQDGKNELKTIETAAPLAPHEYDSDGTCTVCSAKAAAGVKAADAADTVWYNTMAAALDTLTAGAQLTVNANYDSEIKLDKTCTVVVKTGVTVSRIETADSGDFAVTVINNGTINELTGYTGKVTLKSGSGTYGRVADNGASGDVGSFPAPNCRYRTGSRWLHPDETAKSALENVTVAYLPLASLTVTGKNITDESGSYALAANQGDSFTLTAAALDADGKESDAAAYRWYDENAPETSLSTAAELTLENVKAGSRAILCEATADGYSVVARIKLTVSGQKDAQSFTLKLAEDSVGIREKVLPYLSVEGVQEEAAVTYYQMLGETPAPETDTEIGADFSFTETGEYKIYAYTAETDNYAATASSPVAITVTPHADHCICGGTFNHTHENAEWQAWDGKSEIKYEQKWVQVSEYTKQGRYVAYVYLTGNVSANLTVAPKHILYLCLNGYSFTCADPSQPAITLTGEDGKPVELDLCDCVGTGTLGGSNASGGSICIGAYANATLYSGTLTGNNVSGDGGAVSVTGGNCSFTMYGGAITGNTATGNGGGISSYDSWNAGTVNINGGVISNNRATNGGGIYAASRTHFHLNGGEISNNTATGDGGGVYCSGLYSNADGRCEFNGSTISGNTAQRGGGAYVRVCFIGYRNCRITGNTATEAGGGLYLEPFASAKIIYMGSVYGGGGEIAPYIYDNTVNSAQNNLYLSDPDTQIVFTARINMGGNAKIGVYFTGITKNGASVLLNSLQINSESRAKPYLDRILCDNPDYSQLESRKGDSYYDLFLLNTIPESTVTLDPNGGTLTEGDGTISVKYDTPYGTLPTPKRVNYRFDGWFTEKDGGAKVEETTVVATRENHTLYAHWTFIHEHCICGGDTASGDHTVHTDAVFTAWDGKSAISYINKTAYVYLSQNVTFSSNLEVDGTTLYLCLNGNTFASNGTNKIQVRNGGRLVLCDCAGGGTIRGATKGWGGSCVYLYNSTLDIYGGKLTGGKVDGKGGGGAIALDDSKCVLNIYGGEISGNNGKSSGGAIFLNNKDKKGGTVNMYGGLIANNTATNGGVIYSACGGTFNLSGGTIAGNTANNGGVVYATSGGVVNLAGGTISSNKATNGDGGVINMAGGTITLSGTVVTGNTSSRYGGAIYLYNGVTATMTGGAITNNNAAKEGGAVHVYGKNSTFNLSGGSITANSSVDGGAVYLNREPSVLNMTGGEISGNTATGDGGGVYIYRTGSVCNLSGGTIRDNNASGSGGGIYINSASNNFGKLNLSGSPVVTGNTVSGAANNVYLPSGRTLSITGAMTDGALVGVTTANKNYPVAFSGAYDVNYEAYFASDDAAASAEYNTGDQKLYLVTRQYGVTIVVEGDGTAEAAPINAPAGTEITLTAAPAEGHHFSRWIVNRPDVQIYQNKFTMPAGDVTVTAIFEAHSFTEEVADDRYLVSAADCDNDAVYRKSCTCGVAGTETFTKTGSALDHDWGVWTQNDDGKTHTRICSRDASHTETGSCSGGEASCIAKAVCGVCGREYGTLGEHNFQTDWSHDETRHWHDCTRCDAQTDRADHADENKDHLCDVCGKTLSDCADNNSDHLCDICGKKLGDCADNDKNHLCDICGKKLSDCADNNSDHLCDLCGAKLTEHDFSAEAAEEKYRQTAANCQSPAVYYKSCSLCGKAGTETFTVGDKDAANHVGGTEVRNASDAACAKDGYTGDTCCKGCGAVLTSGKVIPAKGHTFGGWTVVRAATTTTAGEKAHSCGVCGYRETAVIPATGTVTTPTPKPSASPTPTPGTSPSTGPSASAGTTPEASPSADPSASSGTETGDEPAASANAGLETDTGASTEPDTGVNTGKRGFGRFLWLWLLLLLLLILIITGRVHYRKYIKKQ